MKASPVAQPCRNHNILNLIRLADPRDGREKAVLSDFVSGGTGSIILIDPDTGAGETVSLPGDSGAWALLNWRDEKLVVGTCPDQGLLHVLDLKTRRWMDPLRDPHETYIWNLCIGSDGMIYGGTYPGCVLLRYDPVAHRLTNLGRMSENPKDLYSRTVYALPGRILVACIADTPQLRVWDIDSGAKRSLGPAGATVREIRDDRIWVEKEGVCSCFDALTLSLREETPPPPPAWTPPFAGMVHSVELRDGRRFVVRGQEYCQVSRAGIVSTLNPIPAERPVSAIQALTVDSKGRIWGACGFGQTIFSWDPNTGEGWNSATVCNAGGEVYGMRWIGERLFLSAYCGGDHIVYDPTQPWDQIGNRNPRTLKAVAPRLIRPEGRSVTGPDGAFWTGWMADYGVYGGGLSRVLPDRLEVDCWYDPIPGQAIIGMAADDRYLYFITGLGGNGLPPQAGTPHFAVWSSEGQWVWRHAFQSAEAPVSIHAVSGRVWIALPGRVAIFDPQRRIFERYLPMSVTPHLWVTLSDGQVAWFAGRQFGLLNPANATLASCGELPHAIRAAVVTPTGHLFAAAGTELFRIDI